jgi:hypothetical protein
VGEGIGNMAKEEGVCLREEGHAEGKKGCELYREEGVFVGKKGCS